MNRVHKFVLAVAMVFAFGCSSDNNTLDLGGDGDKGNDISNYKTVTIGSQTWMAENMNYGVSGSRCYEDKPKNCAKYGRLYNWETAKTVCPSGWHLPTFDEWETLKIYIETDKSCSRCDARHLKATSGWNEGGNGLDSYNFVALPGSGGSSDGYFIVGGSGYWWSATESDANYAYYRGMGNLSAAYWETGYETRLQSVRCVRD